jgi:hypothetical protein
MAVFFVYYLHAKLNLTFMKKLPWILAGFVLLSLAFSFLYAQDNQEVTGDFIIIQYTVTGGNGIAVFRGGSGSEFIKCKNRNPNNCVIDELTKFRSEGYELASTTTSNTSVSGNQPDIFLFLAKKVK